PLRHYHLHAGLSDTLQVSYLPQRRLGPVPRKECACTLGLERTVSIVPDSPCAGIGCGVHHPLRRFRRNINCNLELGLIRCRPDGRSSRQAQPFRQAIIEPPRGREESICKDVKVDPVLEQIGKLATDGVIPPDRHYRLCKQRQRSDQQGVLSRSREGKRIERRHGSQYYRANRKCRRAYLKTIRFFRHGESWRGQVFEELDDLTRAKGSSAAPAWPVFRKKPSHRHLRSTP